MFNENLEQLALPPARHELPPIDSGITSLQNVLNANHDDDEEFLIFGRDLNTSDVLLGESKDHAILTNIAEAFSLGDVIQTSNPYHHTTTSRKKILETSKGSFFIKKKADYCSDESRVRFACDFQSSMAQEMDCVPRLIDSDNNKGYLAFGNSIYIATPVVDGLPFMGREEQVAGAAKALAELHNNSSIYTTSLDDQVEEKDSKTDAIEFISMAGNLEGSDSAANREEVIGQLIDFVEQYSERQSSNLNVQRIITHGDFTVSNLLFDELGNTVAINDFDNCGYNLRIRDVAESIMTFCGGVNYMGATSNLRHPISSGVDINRAILFLNEYSNGLSLPLSIDEVDGIANEMALAWCELMALGIVRGDFNYKNVYDSKFAFIESVEELRTTFAREF